MHNTICVEQDATGVPRVDGGEPTSAAGNTESEMKRVETVVSNMRAERYLRGDKDCYVASLAMVGTEW